MSTDQSTLEQYNENKSNQAGGFDKCDRPRCTATTTKDKSCLIPVVPSLDVCHLHLDQRDENSGDN